MEPVVIRARVRARLLGLPLLTLTARIVAESQENHVLLIPASEAVSAGHAGQDPPSGLARFTEPAEVRPAAARDPAGDRRDDISASAFGIGERPGCHPA